MVDLTALDTRLAAHPYHTLEPGRSRGRLPSEVSARVLVSVQDIPLARAFETGFAHAIEAMLTAFPGNLLWDLEALAARQLQQALAHAQPASHITHLWERVAGLQHLFGEGGPIRFRYIHDFIYGFDWAKWVAKKPEERSGVGPYDAAFVERMHRRGNELLALIDAGDTKYGPLQGPEARNPFSFSREPDDELALHHRLATDGSLPVQAWSADAVPDWRRPYAKLREDAAVALRISA